MSMGVTASSPLPVTAIVLLPRAGADEAGVAIMDSMTIGMMIATDTINVFTAKREFLLPKSYFMNLPINGQDIASSIKPFLMLLTNSSLNLAKGNSIRFRQLLALSKRCSPNFVNSMKA